MTPVENPTKLDTLGIWISSLCALHCLALPVVVPLLPLIGSTFFAQLWFERTILSISLVIGAVALISGALKYHSRYYPLALLAVGGLIYWFKDIFGESGEPFTIATGAMLIVAGHWVNMRLCRQYRNDRRMMFTAQQVSTQAK
ncbi:MerC domain-containing protein [Alteromonas halophila]|uniref:MerC domain-containing protein n=1 Tax=Alteromonas halophila TaxID=516698 RepID=A0A918JGP9_9ALTE|nr:MerC domain-containing protein [Alteromonas halophila]GGW79133.1 hypothetical protein GCM10007391_09780 [Alteromonas halophila]